MPAVKSKGLRRGPAPCGRNRKGCCPQSKRLNDRDQAGPFGIGWPPPVFPETRPRIGKMPVSEVTSANVLEILAPIWHAKAETARRLRQRIRAVLEWAVAMEFRIDNPCDRIDPVLGPQHDVVQHMRALPHRDVASAIEAVRASSARPMVKLAFEFLVLTATRSGEVRRAAWTEIDGATGLWTIPAPRMKGNREHRAPLSRRAGDAQGGACARSRQLAGVSERAPKVDGEFGDVGPAQGVEDRGRATRISVQLSGLCGRGDGSSARGHRAGPGLTWSKAGVEAANAHSFGCLCDY